MVGRGKKLHDVHQRNNLWRVVEEGNVTTEDWVGGGLGSGKEGRLVEEWTARSGLWIGYKRRKGKRKGEGSLSVSNT